MIDLGVVRPGSTIRIPFSTYKGSDGSSLTMTNFAAADILVYKDGSTTERASTSGYTATTDFDSKTGDHIASIDLSDNTTAGFWSAGSEYLVAIDAVTVDGVTTGGWIARFRIGQRAAIFDTTIATLATQTSFTLTAGPAEDNALVGMWVLLHDAASAVQMAWAVVSAYTGSTKTVTLAAAPTFTIAAGDNVSIMDRMPLQPTTFGRTLDVSSGGEAGIDWANVGSQNATVSLSATTVATTTTNTDMVTAGAIRTAVGLASANLDTQLGTIAAYLDTEVAAILAAVDTEVGAIKAVTDKLDSALELDVSVYRFTTNALENAPTGGGGGASWTADQLTAVNTILGVPASGTTPEVPTAGALKIIDDYIDTEIGTINTNLSALITTVGTAGAGLTDIPKTGYKLASDGLNLIIPADPSAIPVLGTATLPQWIAYFGAWTVNEVNSDNNSVDLRNSADSANLATHATSDDGTTFSSAEPT